MAELICVTRKDNGQPELLNLDWVESIEMVTAKPIENGVIGLDNLESASITLHCSNGHGPNRRPALEVRESFDELLASPDYKTFEKRGKAREKQLQDLRQQYAKDLQAEARRKAKDEKA